MTVQIKICMISHIPDSVSITLCTIRDIETIILFQFISHSHVHSSRISLISIWAMQFKNDMSVIRFQGLPEAFLVHIRTAMKIIISLVFAEMIYISIQFKFCSTGTVCYSTYGCANGFTASLIACRIIISQQNISDFSIGIWDQCRYPGRSIIRHMHLQPIIILQYI